VSRNPPSTHLTIGTSHLRSLGDEHALLYCRPEPLQHLSIHPHGKLCHQHLIDQVLRPPQESKDR
jgi:hypothetical protein